MDAERGEKGLQIACRHILALDLGVDDRFVLGRLKRSGQMRRGIADLQRGWLEDAGVLAKIVFGMKIHGYGNAGWRAAGDKQGFGKFGVAFAFGFAVLRGQRAVEVHNASESHGGIEEARRGKIQARYVELGIERSERDVRSI